MNQSNPNINISPSDTVGVECTNCNSLFFDQPVMVRRISRFLTGTTTDQYMFLPVLRCSDCGEILKEIFPEGMTDVEEKLGLTKQTPETAKLININ